MVVSISWSGMAEAKAALDEKVAQTHAATRKFVASGLHMAEAAMKVETVAHGRHKVGTPTPASPGSGPSQIHGVLTRSIKVGPIEPFGTWGWAGEVGPTVIYGRRIEMEYNYPYAGPGWAKTIPELGVLAQRVWREAW